MEMGPHTYYAKLHAHRISWLTLDRLTFSPTKRLGLSATSRDRIRRPSPAGPIKAVIIRRSVSLSLRLKDDTDLFVQWKVQDTGNGWTFQSVYNQKYLDTAAPNNSPPTNGTKVVAVETGEPRAWDIRTDQNDGNACRQVHTRNPKRFR